MDPGKSIAHTVVYYNVLETDTEGRTPLNRVFKWKDKSGFQIISKNRDRESILY